MPKNKSFNSYLISKKAATDAIKQAVPSFTTIVQIVKLQDETFDIYGQASQTGKVINNPLVNVTKTEISNFLSFLSGQTVSANNIDDLQLSGDPTFLLVKII